MLIYFLTRQTKIYRKLCVFDDHGFRILSSAEQLEKILPSILIKSLREFGIIQFELLENDEVRHKRKVKVRRYRIKYLTTQKEVSDEEDSEELNEDQVSEKINTRKEEIEPFFDAN